MPKVLICYLNSRGEGGDKVPSVPFGHTPVPIINNTITFIYQYQEIYSVYGLSGFINNLLLDLKSREL